MGGGNDATGDLIGAAALVLLGMAIPINGIYNGWRMEDAWLDR